MEVRIISSRGLKEISSGDRVNQYVSYNTSGYLHECVGVIALQWYTAIHFDRLLWSSAPIKSNLKSEKANIRLYDRLIFFLANHYAPFFAF
jgi:hypothetical protein